jgi:hypothetical protein
LASRQCLRRLRSAVISHGAFDNPFHQAPRCFIGTVAQGRLGSFASHSCAMSHVPCLDTRNLDLQETSSLLRRQQVPPPPPPAVVMPLAGGISPTRLQNQPLSSMKAKSPSSSRPDLDPCLHVDAKHMKMDGFRGASATTSIPGRFDHGPHSTVPGGRHH